MFSNDDTRTKILTQDLKKPNRRKGKTEFPVKAYEVYDRYQSQTNIN